MWTDEELKKLSTQRLYNVFCHVRDTLYNLDPESPHGYDEEHDLVDRIKSILDTREHLPRKVRKRQSKKGKAMNDNRRSTMRVNRR